MVQILTPDQMTRVYDLDRRTCLACDGTGYREYKHPVPGVTYCECVKGRAERMRILERNRAEQEAERRADLPW